MAVEIERKFLVVSDDWRAQADAGTRYDQGYIKTQDKSVTVRVRTTGEKAFLTLKADLSHTAVTRQEFEYEIPVKDAQAMLENLCQGGRVQKTRYLVNAGQSCFEVDVFDGDNAGLILAEIELKSEGQSFARPPWLGQEVTQDKRYSNAALAQKPYKLWEPSSDPS